jgi:nucleoside-diphosphate-sugar epimerase
MKALLTGGAGFVGSHLAEALLRDGHQVTVIDNLSTGSAVNLRDIGSHPGFRLVGGTVLNMRLMQSLTREVDVIYHLAAAVGVKCIIDSPLQSLQTNLRATEVVLECAAASGTKVVIASTSEVYGKNHCSPLKEDEDSIIGSTQVTRWVYANSKVTNEFLALGYHRERGVPVVIVRFFNLVGPRQTGRYGMVVPRFVEAALRGEPLIIYGDGQQSRCFTDVCDGVRAVLRLSQTPAANGHVFNIGSTQEITIEELARTILRLTGSGAGVRFVPHQQVYGVGFEETRRRIPDVAKLHQTIGFAPDTPLEETLRRIIHYFCTSTDPAGPPLPPDIESTPAYREDPVPAGVDRAQ